MTNAFHTACAVVFAWGSGLQGQLGVECSGTTTPVQSRFRVAEGDKIQLILAGGYHSIIQTTQGRSHFDSYLQASHGRDW